MSGQWDRARLLALLMGALILSSVGSGGSVTAQANEGAPPDTSADAKTA